VRAITVNTQASNETSQHLYLKYEFRRNGFDLRVFGADVSATAADEESI